MADIFLSYASADRERVRPLVQAFEAQGWSVWWDQEIRTGESWDRRIEQALEDCQACVTVFTQTSVESQWVRNESMAAMEAGKLLPVRLDDATVPIAFRSVQTAELTRWRGGQDDRLDQLIATLSGHIHTAARPVPAAAASQSRTRPLRWVAGISLVGLVLAPLIY